MPKFKIIETVIETREVEAENGEEALEIWINEGSDHPAVGKPEYDVIDRRVEEA